MRFHEDDDLKTLLSYLPCRAASAAERFAASAEYGITEIRLRRQRPLAVCCGTKIFSLDEQGCVCCGEKALILSEADMREAWNLVTSSSVYALEEELRRGYITLKGGHRVGICGTAVLKEGRVKTQKNIVSFNYRFSRERKGIGEPLLPILLRNDRFENTLIFSSPGCGKTTLLRDLTRLLSTGIPEGTPRNVAVVDERGEIAPMSSGVCRYDLGPFTDILSAFPKDEGMMLALRSLAPSVLVTDEIGTEEDRRAVNDALRCGVGLLVTAHGGSLAELRSRPILKDMLWDGVFHHIVGLSDDPQPGTIMAIFDRREKEGSFEYVENHAYVSDRSCSRGRRHASRF